MVYFFGETIRPFCPFFGLRWYTTFGSIPMSRCVGRIAQRFAFVKCQFGGWMWDAYRLNETMAGTRSNIQNPMGRPMMLMHSAYASSIHTALAHQPMSKK